MESTSFGLGLVGLLSCAACSGETAAPMDSAPKGQEIATPGATKDAGPAGTAKTAGETDTGPQAPVEAVDATAATCDEGGPHTQPEAGPSFVTGVDAGVASLGGICESDAGGTSDAGAADTGSEGADDAGGPDGVCGCTRRPGVGNSSLCPAGVGEYASTVIGAGGGAVQLAGQDYTRSGVNSEIDFPPTALAAPTTVVLTETATPPPHDLLDWSPVFRVEPLGLELATAAKLQFGWSNVGGVVPAGLAIWFSPDGSCFTPLADSYTNAGFDQASTTRLGYFVVGVARTASTASCP